MNSIFLGIYPPPIAGVLLPIIIVGIISFLLCYAHRFFVFIVVPVCFGLWIYQIKSLEFFTDLLSGYMFPVYTAMILSTLAIMIGTRLSWKKNNTEFSNLK